MSENIQQQFIDLCASSGLAITDEASGIGRTVAFQTKPVRTVVIHLSESDSLETVRRLLVSALKSESGWFRLNRYDSDSITFHSHSSFNRLIEDSIKSWPNIESSDDSYLLGSEGAILMTLDQHIFRDGIVVSFADLIKSSEVLNTLSEFSVSYEVYSGGSRKYDEWLESKSSTGQNENEGLLEREQNLEITLNSIGDAVIATDADGYVTRINPIAARLTGWSAEEAVGHSLKTIFPIINASTQEPIENPVEKVIATGKTVYLSNDTTLIAKDGTEYQISDSAAPIRDKNNNIHGVVLVFNDVTERYRLRKAINESEERFRQLAENINAVFWLGSPDWHDIFYVSPAYKKSWGQNPEDLYQNPRIWIEAVYPDDREQVIDDIPKDIEDIHDVVEFREYRIQKPDGQIRWIKAKAYPIRDDAGNITRIAGIAEDITERVDALEALKNSEAWLAEAQRVAHFGSWNLDLNTSRADWSKELYRLLGYEPYSVDPIPDNFLNRIHKDDRDYVVKELGRPFQEKNREYRAEFRVVLPNNQIRWISERARLFYDGKAEPQRYVGTTLDITERKQQEEKLRQSQKMDALGKLTGGISHDYNNLLGIIHGYAELLQMQLAHEPKLAEFAQDILHASERGTKLTKKLLSFSRSKSSNASLLNINTLLKDEQHMLEKTLTARIKLTYNLAEDLWPVELDGGDLEDAVINLSINAMHAMPDEGMLTIDTSNERLEQAEAERLDLMPGDYVLLSITDTGCGMDETTREKVFEPFYTTKGELGTGLGLSQVYGFVERSGGIIQVYSEPGHGSRFSLYFPRSQSAETEKQDTKINAVVKLSGSETLLVVDDEKAMVELAYEILSTQGYRVLTATDGEQALLVLENEMVDLVISDVIMPNMDGYQLATKIQQHYPDVILQMVSGFADDRHTDLDDIDLHENLLQKPYSSNTLLSRVRVLLDKRK